MRKSYWCGTITGLAFVLILTIPSSADAKKYKPKRTPWGSPDIQGIWDFRNLTPMERPSELGDKVTLTPEEAAAFRELVVKSLDFDNRKDKAAADIESAYNRFWYDFGAELEKDQRTSLIIDPPNGKLPNITPEAQAQMAKQNRLRLPPVRDFYSFSADVKTFRPAGPESLGLSERCMIGLNAGPPLNPSAYNNNLRIVQTPKYIVLVTEMIHNARIVPMDGRPHLDSEMRRWSGDSRGHWEGNTLVVETTNFTDKTPTFQLPTTIENAAQSGAVGSGFNMHLVERFIPVDESTLEYEYTITDPKTFVSPFTVNIPMRLSDGQMYEYACHEGNYALTGMLKGARLLEAED
jgi:hypothetical protein